MADKAPDPAALEQEIARTREELARTIDELVDRVSPRNVAQRGKERLREGAGQLAGTMGSLVVREDEEGRRRVDPRVLAGAGVTAGLLALLVYRRGRR